MKRKKLIRVMRAKDMFSDSFQTFDVKTGQRVSYWEFLPMIEPEPQPVEEPVIKEQLSLF